MRKKGLGKGLDAIFAENDTENGQSAVKLKINELEPNREQPRKEFDEEALNGLADSISEYGVLQPILVRPLLRGGYQIVAGERRWRASKLAGLTEVPVLIKELSDKEVSTLALVENLQREDLSPLEEAEGYRNLMENYSLTQEEAAKIVGKSRSAVANSLRLIALSDEIKDLVREEKLSAGHARALLSIENEKERILLAKTAVEKGYSVRKIEEEAKKLLAEKKKKKIAQKSNFYKEAELVMCEKLGRRAEISGNGKKGSIKIEFFGEEDLKELINTLVKK